MRNLSLHTHTHTTHKARSKKLFTNAPPKLYFNMETFETLKQSQRTFTSPPPRDVIDGGGFCPALWLGARHPSPEILRSLRKNHLPPNGALAAPNLRWRTGVPRNACHDQAGSVSSDPTRVYIRRADPLNKTSFTKPQIRI